MTPKQLHAFMCIHTATETPCPAWKAGPRLRTNHLRIQQIAQSGKTEDPPGNSRRALRFALWKAFSFRKSLKISGVMASPSVQSHPQLSSSRLIRGGGAPHLAIFETWESMRRIPQFMVFAEKTTFGKVTALEKDTTLVFSLTHVLERARLQSCQ